LSKQGRIRDNTDIFARVISNGTDPYLTTQTGAEMKSFTLNDRWAAEMVKVQMYDTRTLEVQFSKNMSGDVLLSDKYAINTNEVPHGSLITAQDSVTYYSTDDASKPNRGSGAGTLVTITMPYNFLGEEQNIFITNSITFFTVATYPTRDPYQPVPHQTVYVNSDVRDPELTPKTLAQSGQTNPRFTTTYHEPAVLWQTPVIAYVNADTAEVSTNHYNQYRNDIATLVEAQKSDYVRLIVRTPVWYDDADSSGLPGTPPAMISGTFNEPNYEGKLTILPVVDRNGVQIPYDSINVTAAKASEILIPSNVVVNGFVTIDAAKAKSVEVNGTISGNVSITSAPEAETVKIKAAVGTQSASASVTITGVEKAKAVEINGAVSGALTVTANNAAITVNEAVGGAVIIDSSRGASVTLNGEVKSGGVDIDADRAIITINEKVTGDVAIDSLNGISVVLNSTVTGDVVIDAGRANVEINEGVTGDVTVSSDIGDEIWIRTDIEIGKTLTVTAPYATVYLMPGVDGTGVVAETVEIIDLDTDTLVIGKGFTVKALEFSINLSKSFTIKYAGEISTSLVINGSNNSTLITVLIQTDNTVAQNAAAKAKFDALDGKTTGAGAGRLHFATTTSLGI
jgi:hypothetical protein